MKLLSLILVVLGAQALAQEPAASPAVVGAVWHLADLIPSSVPSWLLAILVIGSEFLVRLIPTAQPRSILLLVSGLLKAVANVCNKVSNLLDSVIQNLKESVAPKK